MEAGMTSTWYIGPAWIGRKIAAWMLALRVHRCNCQACKDMPRPPVRIDGPAGPPCWATGLWQPTGGLYAYPGERE